MKFFSKFRKAQLLVETIIGIGLVTLVLTAIIPLFLVGVKAGSESWKIENARFLAQETMEATKALKEENWNNIYRPLSTANKGAENIYQVAKSGNAWTLAAGEETVNLNGLDFSRSLTIENVSRTGLNGAGDIENSYNPLRDDPSTQKITVMATWSGSAGITLVNYFTRHKNALFSQTDWSGSSSQANFSNPPGNMYFSETQLDPTIAAGSLRLELIPGGGTANQGNKFIYTTQTSLGRLNTADKKASMRFTAQKSGSINQARIYVQEVRGAVTYRYGIQTEVGGQPDGNYLASGTAVVGATGWQSVNFTGNAALTAGSVYYLVIQYENGVNPTPSANRYINFRSSQPNNNLIPKTGLGEIATNTYFFDGTSWQDLVQQPIFVLRYTDTTYQGNSYDSFENRSIYGANFEGEVFTVAEDTEVSGTGLYVARSHNNTPADNLYVSLYDVTDDVNLISGEIFATPAQVATTTFSWVDKDFSSTVTLLAEHIYRLYFSSPSSAANRNYLMNNMSNPNISEYISLNWQSNDAIATRSSDSGGSFTSPAFVDVAYYLKVGASMIYAPDGELISSTFDTQNSGGGGFNKISWLGLGATPPGTSIKVQLAANNDNTSWNPNLNFYGPGGTVSDWYTLSAGENIWTGLYSESALQSARYLRYKIRLETTDQSVTPVLDSLQINYSP